LIVQLKKGGAQKVDSLDLIESFGEGALASPFRSTVPLLSLIKDASAKLETILGHCGVVGDIVVDLESEVHSPAVGDRPSFTDAMVFHRNGSLAIEAKWTEPMYESVARRLKRKRSNGQDSTEYIEGWVTLLSGRSSKPIHLNHFLPSTYQLLHRAASACGACQDGCPSLAYLHFSSPESTGARGDAYVKALSDFHRLLGSPEAFPFYVVEIPITGTTAFDAIRGLKKGQKDTGRRVKEALMSGQLFELGELEVHRI
jgi:hypothetical protein